MARPCGWLTRASMARLRHGPTHGGAQVRGAQGHVDEPTSSKAFSTVVCRGPRACFGVMIAVVLELCAVSSVGVCRGRVSAALVLRAGIPRWNDPLAGGPPDASRTLRTQTRRSGNSPPRATRAPVFCWPAATSRAVRSRELSLRFVAGAPSPTGFGDHEMVDGHNPFLPDHSPTGWH